VYAYSTLASYCIYYAVDCIFECDICVGSFTCSFADCLTRVLFVFHLGKSIESFHAQLLTHTSVKCIMSVCGFGSLENIFVHREKMVRYLIFIYVTMITFYFRVTLLFKSYFHNIYSGVWFKIICKFELVLIEPHIRSIFFSVCEQCGTMRKMWQEHLHKARRRQQHQKPKLKLQQLTARARQSPSGQ